MTCVCCQGLMREDHFFDCDRAQGFMWMMGWRCTICGYAADPLREANYRLCEAENVAA
jgi:hypothetical protein